MTALWSAGPPPGGYGFTSGLDQATMAYYQALAASQPSVPAVPGLQDAMGALPSRQGDPAAFDRSLSAQSDAGGYNYDPQYIMRALAEKQRWDDAASSVARRFDGAQPDSPVPPFSSQAQDYDSADSTGRNVTLGLLAAGSPGIAAGMAGAYAQPHAAGAVGQFQQGNYGAAAGQGLAALGIGAAGAVPALRTLGEMDPALIGMAAGRAPIDMSEAAIQRRAYATAARERNRAARNRSTDPALKADAANEVMDAFLGAPDLPAWLRPNYYGSGR